MVWISAGEAEDGGLEPARAADQNAERHADRRWPAASATRVSWRCAAGTRAGARAARSRRGPSQGPRARPRAVGLTPRCVEQACHVGRRRGGRAARRRADLHQPPGVASPRCGRRAPGPRATSWVTKTAVRASRGAMRRNERCSRSRVSGSRAPKGSSRSITRGAAASARATPTRCCWPPDSAAGSRVRERGVELDQGEELGDPGRDALAGQPASRSGHRDVLGHAQVREESDAAGTRSRCDRRSAWGSSEAACAPVDEHAPAVRLDETVDHLQGGGLARARAAHEGEQLARVPRERTRRRRRALVRSVG